MASSSRVEPLSRGRKHSAGTSLRRIGPLIGALGKRVRVANRRFVLRALSLAMRRPRSAPAWSARPHDVLYLRPDRVGDMIISTGLLRAIATSHSTMRMHVLVTPSNAGVLEHNPHVASVVLLHHPKRPWTWLSFVRAARRAPLRCGDRLQGGLPVADVAASHAGERGPRAYRRRRSRQRCRLQRAGPGGRLACAQHRAGRCPRRRVRR